MSSTTDSSVPAHPPTEDHDDTVEAHYASLESGEEVEVYEAVPCRRCADRR